jgi:ABC-type cobalamin/Fe3+-siderophores transport system ATPase subunit
MKDSLAIDLDAETAKFFDDSSLNHKGKPELIIVGGGNSVGKTTLIHDKYKKGYVIINAEDIYRNIKIFDEFGPKSQKLVNEIGEKIAKRAISEKRNIVLEMIGADTETMTSIIDPMLDFGYEVDIEHVTGDVAESYKWHLKAVAEDKGYLPTTLTEVFHFAWILKALISLAKD